MSVAETHQAPESVENVLAKAAETFLGAVNEAEVRAAAEAAGITPEQFARAKTAAEGVVNHAASLVERRLSPREQQATFRGVIANRIGDPRDYDWK
mgnify:CR=1 FL=1